LVIINVQTVNEQLMSGQKKATQEFIKNKSEEAVSGIIQNFVKN